MAKSRRNRAKTGQRSDPIAKPAKPPSDPELAAIREKSILPVLKDLQSAEPKSRSAAAGAIANIVQDAKCRKLLLREKIVNILLTETLTDASLESRAAGWEILRELTAKEEPDFCIHLYRMDITTAIQHACAKVTGILTISNPANPGFSKTAERRFAWSIAEALTIIISALALAQDEALDAIVRNEQIVQFLFTLTVLDPATPVLQSTLSCMTILSEDNEKFVEAILTEHTSNCYKQLIAFKNGDGYKAVLACGVLHNVFSMAKWNDQSPGKEGACDAILVPALSQALEYTQLNGGMTNGHGSTKPEEILQLALEILASIGTVLQETLQYGSRAKRDGSFKGFDGNDDAMDADGDEEEKLSDNDSATGDDEMDQDEMEADMDMVTGAEEDEGDLEGIDDLPTLKELIQKAIPQLVKLARDAGNDEASTLIRGHAFSALNNIAWTVSCMDFTDGSNSAVLQAWAPVAKTIWKETITPVLASDTSDVGLATIVTSLSWAVARTLHGHSFLSGDEHNKFMSLLHASQNFNPEEDDPFQSLGVKCVGALGQLAVVADLEVNRHIGEFLLTRVKLLPETPAADAIEALNQLFEIYGDESKECDKEVFWKDNFLQHLEEVVPRVKAMVKAIDKRKSPILRYGAEEVNLNLARFIKYKQAHRP
ncbi:hypothetical protein F4818DRAFT_363221 [Hypoxylon cercidicola]|nr:hypothetical protein F4818DRAFT_363221 [Hypoxylon cercidicola]